MMNRGKLAGILVITLLCLGVCQAYGDYILKNNGDFYINSASLYIDSTPVNTYITSMGNFTTVVNGTYIDPLVIYQNGTSLHDYILEVAPGGTGVVTQASPYTYIVSRVGATYYANSTRGDTNYSGAVASTVIQAAIDELDTAGGGIYIKTGIYPITVQLSITHPILIVGDGSDYEDPTFRGTVLQATAAIQSIIKINIYESGSNMNAGPTFKDFSLDGNGYANECLRVEDALRFKCYDCSFVNAKIWGVLDIFNHSHYYYSCQFAYNGATGTALSGGLEVGTYDAMDSATAYQPANVVQLFGCSVEANDGYGIYVANSQGFMMSGGTVEGNYRQGIRIGYTTNTANYTVASARLFGVCFEDNAAIGSINANGCYNYSFDTIILGGYFYESLLAGPNYAWYTDSSCIDTYFQGNYDATSEGFYP